MAVMQDMSEEEQLAQIQIFMKVWIRGFTETVTVLIMAAALMIREVENPVAAAVDITVEEHPDQEISAAAAVVVHHISAE